MRWQFDYFGGKCRTQRASCLIFWLMIDDSWVQSHNRSLKCLQLWVVSPWFSTFPSLLTMIWNQLSKWNWAGQLSSMCLYYISTLRIQKQVIIHITGAFELLPWYLFLNSEFSIWASHITPDVLFVQNSLSFRFLFPSLQ